MPSRIVTLDGGRCLLDPAEVIEARYFDHPIPNRPDVPTPRVSYSLRGRAGEWTCAVTPEEFATLRTAMLEPDP